MQEGKNEITREMKWPWGLIVFNVVAIAAFTVYYVSIKNLEFLWYIGVMVFFFALILATLKRTRFPGIILWGLSLWGFMHMAGGGVVLPATMMTAGAEGLAGTHVLYSWVFWHVFGTGEFIMFKFDQLVHFIGFGVSTLVFYHLIRAYLDESKVNYKVLYVLVILGGMGIGALSEIIEFIASISFDSTGVGGYANTMLDLVFNTLGAIAAAFIIHFSRKKVPTENKQIT